MRWSARQLLGHNLVALLPVLHVLPGGLWIDGKVNSFKSTSLHSLFEFDLSSGGHEYMVRNSGSPPSSHDCGPVVVDVGLSSCFLGR